jgi:hypothetical protein
MKQLATGGRGHPHLPGVRRLYLKLLDFALLDSDVRHDLFAPPGSPVVKVKYQLRGCRLWFYGPFLLSLAYGPWAVL